MSNVKSSHETGGPGLRETMRFAANLQPVRHLSPRALVRLAAGLALALVYVAPPRAQSPLQSSQPCAVSGLVQSGSLPLPGAAIVALGADGAEISSTSSEQNGSYVLRLSGPGTYKIRASLAAFAPATREATLAAGDCNSRLDLVLVLASRVRRRCCGRCRDRSGATHDGWSAFDRPGRHAAGRQALDGADRPAPVGEAGALRQAQGRAGSSSSTSSPTRQGSRQPLRPTTTRRRRCGPSCSCLRVSQPMRRPRPSRRPASRGNRTTRCSLAGAAGAASSARADLTDSDAAARAASAAVATRAGSAEAVDVAAGLAAAAPAASAAVPVGSGACAAADAFRATPTTTSAGRCSMPRHIHSTVACVKSLTTSSSATDPPSAVR